MKTVTEWLRERVLKRVRPEMTLGVREKALECPADILEDHASPKFLCLMLNRLVFGYFRYGPRKVPGRKPTQNIDAVRKRITLYEETGNQEHLVDVANFALVEFMKPCHPNPHFSSTDDGVHDLYVDV